MSVTRDKLYEEVWAEPMAKVAVRYRISANYLATGRDGPVGTMADVVARRRGGDHDPVERVITMPWNDCSRWRGARRMAGSMVVSAADAHSGQLERGFRRIVNARSADRDHASERGDGCRVSGVGPSLGSGPIVVRSG